MLIEFSVANFFSFKERQTFSMVASKNKELEETHTFVAPISGGRDSIRLLRSAAVYGANAAGKTNLLFAIEAMQRMVVESASEQLPGEQLKRMIPFKLDSKKRNEPSEFEIHLIADGVRYQYGFAANEARVVEEWLIAFPHGRAQRWFDRTWNSKTQKYKWDFGASFKGAKELWKKSTRENALFLSIAVRLNSEQLWPLYDWFRKYMSMSAQVHRDTDPTVSSLEEGGKEKVLDFLKSADLDIHDVLVEKKPGQTVQMNTVHLDKAGKRVSFPWLYESNGTQKIFSLAAGWLRIQETNRVVGIDELHIHMHLALAKFLVAWFHSDRSNPNNSQLIFTTHETSLLDQNFLRRDQIWFCEKTKDNATSLYPLTDFHPRKGRENLELGYRSGVYGAVPYIREL
ncbi:MAG: RloA protein [Arenicellales bacterium IbO2]|nr:ATP-binding protein [Gammaproteobacteria bacterium]MDA7961566.1 ATP-binding protein [Gammaproteobacteria bacterium]MDA7995286.1 ATP-binding protein [Gammaproteobacteria bacterium]MDA8024637.1 ATP-binding protein [Gammaproteobacteria bacterium]CAJ2376695.1 MAG: RloA protein [Arenicellales bacterium IbO2]